MTFNARRILDLGFRDTLAQGSWIIRDEVLRELRDLESDPAVDPELERIAEKLAQRPPATRELRRPIFMLVLALVSGGLSALIAMRFLQQEASALMAIEPPAGAIAPENTGYPASQDTRSYVLPAIIVLALPAVLFGGALLADFLRRLRHPLPWELCLLAAPHLGDCITTNGLRIATASFRFRDRFSCGGEPRALPPCGPGTIG